MSLIVVSPVGDLRYAEEMAQIRLSAVPFQRAAIPATFERSLANGNMALEIAFAADVPVAFGYRTRPHMDKGLVNLVTHRDWRRQGIGKIIFDKLAQVRPEQAFEGLVARCDLGSQQALSRWGGQQDPWIWQRANDDVITYGLSPDRHPATKRPDVAQEYSLLSLAEYVRATVSLAALLESLRLAAKDVPDGEWLSETADAPASLNMFDANLSYVAVDPRGSVVGLTLVKDFGNVDHVMGTFVIEEFRRQGVARCLKAESLRARCPGRWMTTEVRGWNSASIALNEALGFIDVTPLPMQFAPVADVR